MLLRQVEYARPTTVDEAIRLLGEHPNARPLAGGQTLINVMKARAAAPDVLVDLNALDELREIRATPDGGLEVGALVTYAQLTRSAEVAERRPILAHVAEQIADVQVRNRGTLGGNLCLSDPTNHFPPLAVALNAQMTIRGADGERVVPAEEFFLGVYFTAVGSGELLTRVAFPASSGGDGFSAVTIGRDGTCIANAAAMNGESPRVVLGCVAATPVRATELEAELGAGDLSEERVREAVRGLGETLDPPSDVHASADYRRHLAEICAARAIVQATRGGVT